MKNVINSLYVIFLSTYFYNQRKDLKESRDIAFVAVRNLIGVFFFMILIALAVISKSILNFEFRMRDYRFLVYLTGFVIILSYIKYAKKHIKPLFKDLEPVEKYKDNNVPYILIIVLMGLYSGGVFVLTILMGKMII